MLSEKEIEQIRLDAEKKYPASNGNLMTAGYEGIKRMRLGYISGRTEGGESANGFAEWISINGWSYWPNFPGTSLQKKEPVWIKEEAQDPLSKLPTTSELFDLYNKK